jgi:hypothetical protein
MVGLYHVSRDKAATAEKKEVKGQEMKFGSGYFNDA